MPTSDLKELCLAYLKERNSEVLGMLAIKCASAPNGPGQILALFDFLAHFYENQDFCGCWARRTAAEQPTGDTKIRSEVLRGKAELVQFITSLLAENMTSLGSEESAALARKIYLLYEGAVSESHLQLNIWPVTEAREMCEILLTQAQRQN